MEKPELELLLHVAQDRYKRLSKNLRAMAFDVLRYENVFLGRLISKDIEEHGNASIIEFDETVEKLSAQYERIKYCEEKLEELKWKEEE